MNFNDYQTQASQTATFDNDDLQYALMYIGLGIGGESGEILEKIKKYIRNKDISKEELRSGLKSEIGDVLWYLSQLARMLKIPFDEVAEASIAKILDRQSRNVIKSSGDTR